MSEIVEAVKDGLRTALAKRPGWSQQGSYVVNNAVFTDISPRDLEALARAAIDAYEAAKREAGEADPLALEARELYRDLVGDTFPMQTHEQRMESQRAADK